jgi:hypothetical protein
MVTPVLSLTTPDTVIFGSWENEGRLIKRSITAKKKEFLLFRMPIALADVSAGKH